MPNATSSQRGIPPIIGIGASAGGLHSLQCFIAALPKEFNFVIVFVQHLSTKHKSLLHELLLKQRPDLDIIDMPDGLEALAGKIYLCPPGAEIRLQKGRFRVNSPLSQRIPLPIDEFLISLAEEAGDRATAVIFSGAGTDGARGVKEIRSRGGTVFVQDPATAEFPSMPRAAMAAGHIDGVLPPADIVPEILKLYARAEAAGADPLPLSQLEPFYRVIREKTGYRFDHYKKSVVSRRIRRRMFLNSFFSTADYLKMVTDKDAEAAALASDIMIGVTSFFRDRVAWKALKLEVIRKLAVEEEDDPIRVWTPACASGEEAYSIAMMLAGELAGRREIQVFATDVNDRALDRAREGKYPGSISADIPADFMRKYFTCSEDGDSVLIGKEIRERVVFARHDLLTDPPFSRLDLIICRNLLIYLEPDAQEKCIALFHYALKDGKYLFLGNAESATRNSELFRSVGHKKCRLYQKMAAVDGRLPLATPFARERAPVEPDRTVITPKQQSLVEFIQEAILEGYAPAAVAVDQNYNIFYHNGPTSRYLQQPRGKPTQNLLELLPQALRTRLRGALYRADKNGRPVSMRVSLSPEAGQKRALTLRISRLRQGLFLIVFREKTGEPERAGDASLDAAAVEDSAVRQLENELSSTREALQSNIEQLKSLNEELQSSNEELHAANEELETSREELQSLNEELITVNAQLQSKIEEQEETNNDLTNFLTSTNIPTLFLDHQFRVRRFTSAMSRLVKLIPADLGRPIIDMSQENLGPDLIADAREVLDHLTPLRKEIPMAGAWFIRSVLPYRTSDNRIEGVVVTYNDVSDLKQAEKRTRHLASFPQFNPNPVIEVDVSGKITFCNPAAETILESVGTDRGDISLLLPADLDAIVGRLRTEDVDAVLHREASIGGRIFAETVYLSPQFQVVRIYAFDITEIRKAQEVRGRLAAIVESAEDAIISKDLDGVITTWNVGAERVFGYTADEAVGKNISLLLPPGHADEVPEILKKIAHGEHIEHLETLRMRKDGVVIPVSLTFSAIRDEGGRIVGASKIAHDISDRKRTEEALLQAKHEHERHSAQLQTILDNLTEGLVVADMEANIFHWNPAAIAMHGFASMEECRRKLPELADIFELSTVRDGVLPLEQWPLARILRGETLRDLEAHLRRRGTDWERVFSYGGTLARDKDGNPLLAIVTVADITGRKQAEAELLRLNKVLKALSDSSQAVIRAGDEAEYLNEVCRIVIEDCSYSMVWIGFADNDEAKTVRPVAYSGFEKGYLETLDLTWADTERGQGPTGTAIRTGRIATCRNIPGDPAFAPWRQEAVKRGYASSIVFPLFMDNRVLGAITIYSRETDPFSEGEVKFLAELADNLAYGIKVLRIRKAQEQAEESLHRSLGRFELLSLTAGELLQSTEPQKVVESVCRKVMEHLDCSAFFNFVVDERAGRLHLNACDGIPEEEARRIEWLDFGVAVCGCAARDGAPIVAEHIPATPDERTELVGSYGIKAYCCHPLLGPGGKVIGTLSFGAGSRETFSDQDISVMKAVADQVAAAMIRMKNEADVLALGEDMAARNMELESVNAELESFIYSVSHDLRAPLRTISGFARFLAEDYTEQIDDRGRDYLARICRGSEKMSRLIDDLLNLSKISRQEIQRANVDLSGLASSVAADLRESDPGREVEILITDGLTAFADMRLTEIVLLNLMGNAWKFTSAAENARIEFGALRQDGKTVYFVKDNGAGFDPKYTERMFWPFHRLHSEHEFEGTGIGLTIVERLIRRHGGKIWAEGEIGKGATFFFTLD